MGREGGSLAGAELRRTEEALELSRALTRSAAAPAPHGRFAPSPTGSLHLGNLRTALLAWLFARSSGSRFLVRVEDLDSGRVRPGIEGEQLADLAAIGLDWDAPVVRQSERRPLYDEALAALERVGLLYRCWCSRREIREAASAPHGELPDGAYPGTCRELSPTERRERERSGRPPALRLDAGAARVKFADRLLGPRCGIVDDFVVRRGDGVPAYNLAVVVDDAAQGIAEVVRGSDLADSTPRQLHLTHLLELPAPAHAHVPLLLGPDGARLAKRHGAVTMADRRAMGETPRDVLGHLAHTAGLADQRERPTATELLERFDPLKLHGLADTRLDPRAG